MPEFTDHTISHMDGLWRITDSVLTSGEIQAVTTSEAFVLGACFYVHDLGMAVSAIRDMRESLRTTKEYATRHALLLKRYPGDPAGGTHKYQEITRQRHASLAQRQLVTDPIPQLGKYLLEESDFRDEWAILIGEVAESHWSLEDVDRKLASRGMVPSPDGDDLDPGYVACLLRVIDFAHINRERANDIDRSLRDFIGPESSVHWDAQKNITGPSRDGDFLVYGYGSSPSTP